MARTSRTSPKDPGAGSRLPPRTKQWHAVEIVCDPEACAAARSAASVRYLAAEAPLLPLRDCERRAQCGCRYRHYEDRRAGPRRSSEGAPPRAADRDQLDRRYMEGRRDDDREDDDGRPAEPASILDDTYYNYIKRSKPSD